MNKPERKSCRESSVQAESMYGKQIPTSLSIKSNLLNFLPRKPVTRMIMYKLAVRTFYLSP